MKTTITRSGLKGVYIREIQKDPELAGKVAAKLNRSVLTLHSILKRNDMVLTSYDVLAVLRKKLGVSKITDLLEPVQDAA